MIRISPAATSSEFIIARAVLPLPSSNGCISATRNKINNARANGCSSDRYKLKPWVSVPLTRSESTKRVAPAQFISSLNLPGRLSGLPTIMSACRERSSSMNVSGSCGVCFILSRLLTIRYVPRISWPSAGRTSGITPESMICFASSTLNRVCETTTLDQRRGAGTALEPAVTDKNCQRDLTKLKPELWPYQQPSRYLRHYSKLQIILFWSLICIIYGRTMNRLALFLTLHTMQATTERRSTHVEQNP